MSQSATLAASRLADFTGAEHVITSSASLSAYTVDGLSPWAAVRPGSAAEAAEVLAFAAAERLAVIPTGGRSKLAVGMPPRKYDLALDMSRMNRVLAYDPGDLTLGVEPGVRYAELAARLAGDRQFLPLAPPFAGRSTIGGIIAAGCDSPLRHAYGSARDFLLGMEFVTGGGVASKSGGRVVKNVTGYDLHKLLVGSLGTLAVITRINLRTFPVAPEQKTFLASFTGADAALGFCWRLADSQLQPRMVETLSPATAAMFAAAGALPAEPCWRVAIGVAGHHAAVERHARELARLARDSHPADFAALDPSQPDALLEAIADFSRITLEQFPGAAILRIATLPAAMLALIEHVHAVAERHGFGEAILARAAGIVYAAILPPAQETAGDPAATKRLAAACQELMAAVTEAGGRPMIEWCPLELKREMSVWPPAGGEQELAQRLKNVFDPHGILAPGRFQGGI
jgi:glycolate oxidase FAD binding subunit